MQKENLKGRNCVFLYTNQQNNFYATNVVQAQYFYTETTAEL